MFFLGHGHFETIYEWCHLKEADNALNVAIGGDTTIFIFPVELNVWHDAK